MESEPASWAADATRAIDTDPASVAAVADRNEILALKHRYLRALDLQNIDGLRTCFTSDAAVSFSNGRYSAEGLSAIMDLVRATVAADYFSVHLAVHPEIEVLTATSATGIWRTHTTSFWLDQGRESRTAGFSYDEYVRHEGAWLFRRSDSRLTYASDGPLPGNLETFQHRGDRTKI